MTVAGGESKLGTVLSLQITNQHSTLEFIRLYFSSQADSENDLIRRVDVSTGTVTTLAGVHDAQNLADGVGTSAEFDTPWGIAVNGANNFALVVSIL